MTTLLPTMKLTLLSYATVQVSSQNHSCLLCQSRKNKMHMEEEAGQTLDKKTFISLSKRVGGNHVRGMNSVNISFLWIGERLNL